MKLRRSSYARPEIFRGQQCAGARLGRRSDRASTLQRNTVGRLSPRSLDVLAQECRCRPCLRHRVLDQVRCERPASTRACPGGRGPVSGASERPDVRCLWVPARLGLGRRRRRWMGSGEVDHQRLDAREDRPLVGTGLRSEAATTLGGHRVRPRAESPGRCEPPGLDCDLRVRPWCGRSMRRAPPARRWRRSDLRGWGGGEGI
jgi:hypothetical protein